MRVDITTTRKKYRVIYAPSMEVQQQGSNWKNAGGNFYHL